jgi:tight adherence protein C
MTKLLLELLIGLLVAWGVYAALVPLGYAARVLGYAGPTGSGPAPRRGAVWREAAPRLAALVERLAPAHYVGRSRALLRQAGYYRPAHLQGYMALQLVGAVGFALVGALFGARQALAWAALGAGLGAMAPWLVLRHVARRRKAALDAVLPDTLDLLTACVEAGLGLDAAIVQVATRRNTTSRAMNEELTRYLQETRMGVPRAEALRALAARSGIDELRQVVTALIQGDTLGVGVAQILRAQTQHIRMVRKQRAEEKAMKAPIKILFPLVFGIFPAIFTLILGPAVLRLYDTFAAGPRGF